MLAEEGTFLYHTDKEEEINIRVVGLSEVLEETCRQQVGASEGLALLSLILEKSA